MEHSFSHAKSAVLHVLRLVHPVPSVPISLVIDASESHIGAVLQQRIFFFLGPTNILQQETLRPGDTLFCIRP